MEFTDHFNYSMAFSNFDAEKLNPMNKKNQVLLGKNLNMSLPKNINIRFLLATAALVLLVFILQLGFPVIIHSKIWEIVGFMAILSFLISFLNSFLLKTLPDNFFQIMVLAMILRFIASLVFIGVEVWPGMENIILFIADFFIVFLFYLAFDIYAFLSNLRPISK